METFVKPVVVTHQTESEHNPQTELLALFGVVSSSVQESVIATATAQWWARLQQSRCCSRWQPLPVQQQQQQQAQQQQQLQLLQMVGDESMTW